MLHVPCFMKSMAKILFVEDEPALQKTLSEALKQNGYEVQSAFDGQQGLELAKSAKPDLILLDLILPKLDGFGVLKALKTEEKLRDIPVIILTNLEDMTDVEKALELGASTYLVKANYDLDELVNKITQTLTK